MEAERRQRAEAEHQQRLEQVAEYCADIIEKGALDAVPDRAAEYVGEQLWDRAQRHWRSRNCTALAHVARKLLEGKAKLHKGIGKIIGYLVGLMGGTLFARILAEKLGAKLPLPLMDQVTAAARGLQIAGVFFCSAQDRPLADCACFKDVFRYEGTELLKRLVVAAVKNWAQLHHIALEGPGAPPYPIGAPPAASQHEG